MPVTPSASAPAKVFALSLLALPFVGAGCSAKDDSQGGTDTTGDTSSDTSSGMDTGPDVTGDMFVVGCDSSDFDQVSDLLDAMWDEAWSRDTVPGPGKTIRLCAGSYAPFSVFFPLSIIADDPLNRPTIDATGSENGVRVSFHDVDYVSTFLMQDLDVLNASDVGVSVDGGNNSIVLSGVNVENNCVEGDLSCGGARLSVEGMASISLTESVFSDNSGFGCVIGAEGSSAEDVSEISILESAFDNNLNTGLSVNSFSITKGVIPTVLVDASSISNNRNGGLQAFYTATTVRDTHIDGNLSDGGPAGIYPLGSVLTISGGSVKQNVTTTKFEWVGGGLEFYDAGNTNSVVYSYGVDWGNAYEQNLPHDVTMSPSADDQHVYDYSGKASFVCEEASVSCRAL